MEAHSNMEVQTAKMCWKISNFPIQLINKRFCSPIFETDASRWGLMVERKWLNELEYLHVYVHMDKENVMPAADVQFSINIPGSYGPEIVRGAKHFERDDSFGYKILPCKSVLLSGDNDCLTIVVELKVCVNKSSKIVNAHALNKARPVGAALSQNFEHFFGEILRGERGEGGFSDFTIKTQDGGDFPVHRAILAARSKVFKAMLSMGTTETISHQMFVTDVDSCTMRALLLFLYTDRVDVDGLGGGKVIDLFVVADKYQLVELKEICVQAIESSMSVDTVCEMLVIADFHAAPALKAKLMQFVSTNRDSVLRTEGWAMLKRDHLHLIDELFLFGGAKSSLMELK